MDKYSETLERIYHLRGGMIDLRLDRMEQALALFDHPEKNFSSIHIAGTNGKGSTSAMLHSILSLAGYRTALYTSPHLVSFNERIRVGEDDLTQDEVAVVEVGLGGRLDATNVVTPMVSVITTISTDHEAYLGPDERSIAREKGGIIKPAIPVICGKISPQVAELLRAMAGEHRSPAYFLGTDFGFSLKSEGLFDYTGLKRHYSNIQLALRGRHQRANASMALAALELSEERFPVSETIVRRGLQTVQWPGRLEVMFNQPTVVLDGAHNTEGVRALVDEMNDFRQGRKIRLLFATMADKEWQLMLGALTKAVDEVIFTRVAMERSADPDQLAETAGASIPHRTIHDSRVALRTLLGEARSDDIILVAGSLYLLGEIRPMLLDIATARAASGARSPI